MSLVSISKVVTIISLIRECLLVVRLLLNWTTNLGILNYLFRIIYKIIIILNFQIVIIKLVGSSGWFVLLRILIILLKRLVKGVRSQFGGIVIILGSFIDKLGLDVVIIVILILNILGLCRIYGKLFIVVHVY